MSDSPAPKKSSIFKIFGTLVLAALGLLLLTAALLPSIVSSTWGKKYLINTVNHSIPGQVTIDNLSFSWFGPQKLQGVTLADPQGATVLTLQSATIDSSLFKLILNPTHIGTFNFKAFNATLVTDASGNTNLMRALDASCCQPKSGEPLKAVLSNVNGELKASADAPFTLKFSGETQQGSLQGKFNVDAALVGVTVDQLIKGNQDLSKLMQSNPNADLKINADITNFPVEMLDQIVALKSPEKAGLLIKLLGQQLNVTVTQKTIPEGISLLVRANSPTLTAAADLSIAKEITLSKPATVALQVSPEALDQFFTTSDIPWKLSAATTANVTINKLILPLAALSQPLDQLNPNDVALTATVDVGEANLINDANKVNITVKGVHVGVITDLNAPNAAVSLTADATNNQQPMKVNINVTVPKTIFWKDLTHLNLKDILVNGQISGAPLFVLNGDSPLSNMIAELVGPKADLTFSLKAVNGMPLATLQYDSERLQVPNLQLWIGEKIALHQPVQIVARIPATVVNQTFKEMTPRLQSPVIAQLDIKSLSLPTAHLHATGAKLLASMYKVDMDATLSVSQVKFIGLPGVDAATLNDFAVRIEAATHMRPELKITGNIQPDGPGKLYDLIGKKADVNFNASLGLGLDGKPTLTVFNMNVDSELGRAEMSGKMLEGQRLVLNSPAMISYTLTSAGLSSLGLTSDNFHFSNTTPMELTIDTSHIPLDHTDLSLLKLAGKIKINDFQVWPKGQKGIGQATLDNMIADWSVDAANNSINLNFAGITLLGQQAAAGKLNGSVAISGWIRDGQPSFGETTIRVKTVASNLPTQFLSGFSESGHDFVSLIGDAMNVDLLANVSMKSASQGSVDIELSSDNLSGSIALALGEVIRLSSKRPTEFHLNLTPSGYEALRQMIKGTSVSDFKLTETAKATFKMSSLSLPVGKSILQAGIEGNYLVEKLVGQDTKTKNRLTISSMQGRISSHNISEHVDFDMAARGQTGQGAPTSWSLMGAMDKGFTPNGSVNHGALSLQLDATIETLPISLLCQFICVDQSLRNKFEALIGPTLNAKVKAQLQHMTGPLYVDLQGKNGNLTIDASLGGGYLTLKRPLTAQVAVTPQLSKYVLSDLIPVISGMLAADHPIKLTIDPQGFSLPISNPSMLTVAIGRAMLEMGKVSFSNSSQLAKVLSLLKPTNADQFMVWLTPAYFSLNQGVLDLQRVDMLISDSYPIAAWGNVDLARERVHMIIGLSGSAIQRAFNVSGLPKSYFLQIPLRGKLDSPSFDKTKAAARLSAIVAQTQGGPQGMVIGTVIDIASGGLTEPPPPPPTTNPLPWAELMVDPPGTEKKTIDKQILSPIEEVGKGASSILKKLFK